MSLPNQPWSGSLAWLLEPADPGVRYLALRDLATGVSPAELSEARRAAHTQGPIAAVLAAMHPDGYWSAPSPRQSLPGSSAKR